MGVDYRLQFIDKSYAPSMPQDDFKNDSESASQRRQVPSIRSSIPSSIHERASSNPYVSKDRSLNGLSPEQLGSHSYLDALYLTFRGAIPTPDQSDLLAQISSILLLVSPRDGSVRGTAATACSRTQIEHLVPIAAMLLGTPGPTGSGSVSDIMLALRRSLRNPATDLVDRSVQTGEAIPGFGTVYGDIDAWASTALALVLAKPAADSCLKRANELNDALKPYRQGILMTGVAAAAFADLGFRPKEGVILMQYLQLPAVLAQSLDVYGRMDVDIFPSDDDYHIEGAKGDY